MTTYRIWHEDTWIKHRQDGSGRAFCRRKTVETAFATAGWLSDRETQGTMVVEDPIQGLVWRVKSGEVT